MQKNVDAATVKGFGAEWTAFNQAKLKEHEALSIFNDYFCLFPWHLLSAETAVGLDAGCGSGRWAALVAPKTHKLYVLDASSEALAIAKSNLQHFLNVEYICAPIEDGVFPEKTLDFAYSLGVLHHIPDTGRAILAIAKALKKDAPFLLYLYYNFENKPWYYRWIWKLSDLLRYMLSRCPFFMRKIFCDIIALMFYWPLARIAWLGDACRLLPKNWPLSYYKKTSFYTMRTDALDRFGTRLERRFSRADIQAMLEQAGFVRITFSDKAPFWCVIAFKQ